MSTHSWLYLEVIDGRQIVKCRRCDKVDSYRIVGYKPEPPETECEPPDPQWTIPLSLRGYAP